MLSLTEKPGAILTWIRVPDAARDLPPGVSSLTVSVQPPCAMVCINISVHVKNNNKKQKTLAAIPLFGHTKIQHTLIGMGSAALAAAVP